LTEKELKKQKKAARNFHYNILGGPSYTPDFGLLIGGSALMTFRMNPKDTTMHRSVIPICYNEKEFSVMLNSFFVEWKINMRGEIFYGTRLQ
jgi:hypothetical protein